jgi:hypothetical protein
VFQVKGLDRLWPLRSRLGILVAHLTHIEESRWLVPAEELKALPGTVKR